MVIDQDEVPEIGQLSECLWEPSDTAVRERQRLDDRRRRVVRWPAKDVSDLDCRLRRPPISHVRPGLCALRKRAFVVAAAAGLALCRRVKSFAQDGFNHV